jgi:hypothetical protein
VTVNASATAELSIDQIVRQAYILASMMAIEEPTSGVQWAQRSSYARMMLEAITKGLEAEGRLVRAKRFYNLTLVAGQSSYTLPPEIMDVYGDAAFIEPGQPLNSASFETLVRQIDQETWQRLGVRDATGLPTLYFLNRGQAPLEVRLWLTPDAGYAGTIRFQTYYFLANSNDGNATPDLERHWTRYLAYALAQDLAEGAGLARDKVMGLGQMADMLLQKAKGYSRQRTNNIALIMHGSGRRW